MANETLASLVLPFRQQVQEAEEAADEEEGEEEEGRWGLGTGENIAWARMAEVVGEEEEEK